MSFALACGACGGKFQAPDNLAGRKIPCPGCAAVVVVPGASLPGVGPASLSGAGTLLPVDGPGGTQLLSAAAKDNPMPELSDFLVPAQAPDEIGRLGTYRVLKVLGRGGMGVVYLAEDPQLGRRVALKVMLPALASCPEARERFLREARAAAAIEHDHIVAIYQVGEDRGAPFLAMPFLKGEPLDARLRKTALLPLAEVLRIGREIAEGLSAAHEQGLIHRDVKPANIWLEGAAARVKILDFGLARSTGKQANLTQTGVILGTPAYMAPEQAKGQTTDARSDLFSLGCVLYQLCTGERPFQGADVISTLVEVVNHDPTPPHELEPRRVSIELSDLVMRLLAKNADRRPSSAQATAEALRDLEAGRKKGAPGRLSRRRLWVALAAGVGMLLVAGGVLAVLNDGRQTVAVKPPDEPPLPEVAVPGPEKPPPIAEPVREVPAPGPEKPPPIAEPPILHPAQQPLLLAGAQPIDRLERVKLLPPEAGADPRVVGALLAKLPGVGEGITRVAFGPDGKTLAMGTNQGLILLWDVPGWKERKRLTGRRGIVCKLEFSPDGGLLASATKWGDGAVQVWDTDKGANTDTCFLQQLPRSLAFSRDGKLFATGAFGTNAAVKLYDVSPQGKLRQRHLADSKGSFYDVMFHPDGKTLMASGHHAAGGMRSWDVRNGKLVPTPGPFKQIEGHCLCCSRDGKLFAWARKYQTRVFVVEVSPPRPRHQLVARGIPPAGAELDLVSIAFTPDSKTAVAAYMDGTVRLWDVANGTEKAIVSVTPEKAVRQVACSPEGRHLAAVAENKVYIIRLRPAPAK